MSQDFIDFVEIPQFGRNSVETIEPALVSALLQELAHLLLNQVRTLMTAGSLKAGWVNWKEEKKRRNVFLFLQVGKKKPKKETRNLYGPNTDLVSNLKKNTGVHSQSDANTHTRHTYGNHFRQ